MVSPGEGGLTLRVGSVLPGQVEAGLWPPALLGVKGRALSRGIQGTQPHEGGKGTLGLALWALQGLQAHGRETGPRERPPGIDPACLLTNAGPWASVSTP